MASLLSLGMGKLTTAATGQGGSGLASVLGIVANRLQIPTNVANITPNYTSRRSHYASSDGDITAIQCLDVGWFFSTSTYKPVATSTRTFKRFIEYPENTFHQVTWGGATVRTINGSGGDGTIKSDIVLSSVTGKPLVINKGEQFFERTVNLNATVGDFPVIELPAGSATLGLPDGNVAGSDLGNSGTIATSASIASIGAACLIGSIKANARSFVLFGDSITFGQGDITGTGTKGASGYVARILDKSGYPYVKICQKGQSASDVASGNTSIVNFLAQIPFTDAIYEHGVNDLRLGRTKAQIEADYQTLYALSAGRRIVQSTITPRSTSTNSWADVEGQTAATDGNMASLNALNADIREGLANVSAVIDAADVAMSARDSDVFGGPFPPTIDGTHMTSAKAAAMAMLLST